MTSDYSESISPFEVDAAIGKMTLGKTSGATGVVAEMLKAAGEIVDHRCM